MMGTGLQTTNHATLGLFYGRICWLL